MNNEKVKVEVGGGGIGFFGLLTILFIGLKFTGHIDWSWLWVLSPLWGPFALIVTIWLSLLCVAAVGVITLSILSAILNKLDQRNKRGKNVK